MPCVSVYGGNLGQRSVRVTRIQTRLSDHLIGSRLARTNEKRVYGRVRGVLWLPRRRHPKIPAHFTKPVSPQSFTNHLCNQLIPHATKAGCEGDVSGSLDLRFSLSNRYFCQFPGLVKRSEWTFPVIASKWRPEL